MWTSVRLITVLLDGGSREREWLLLFLSNVYEELNGDVSLDWFQFVRFWQ